MKKYVIKTLSLLAATVLFTVNCFALVSTEYNSSDLTEPLEAVAENVENNGDLTVNSKSAILMEANTGTVLFAKNETEKCAPASITKIMTLLLVAEALETGKINLQTTVTAGEHACSMGGSQIWLEPNEQMTVNELLKAVCVASANDAAVALAEAISGTEQTFVEQMNKKAKLLNLKCTNFENCTGLDSNSHYTCAYDVAVMSQNLIKHKIIKNYTTIWMDTLRNGKNELVNTNKLVKYYSGCTGLKTGTTSKAGSCLSATAERDGLSLIAVVMGAETGKERFDSARLMLNYGFANYKTVTVEVDRNLLNPIKVKNGFEEYVTIEPNGTKTVLTKKSEQENIKTKINLNQTLTAPVLKGQKVGECEIFCNNKKIAKINITAKSTVKKCNIVSVAVCLLKFVIK